MNISPVTANRIYHSTKIEIYLNYVKDFILFLRSSIYNKSIRKQNVCLC